MYDAIVIGRGILGGSVYRQFASQGRKVLCIDRGEILAGSVASAGHIRPSKKFTGLDNSQYDKCVEHLESLFGLEEEEFKVQVKLLGTVKEVVKVCRVDPQKLEEIPTVKGDVTQIQFGKCPSITFQRNGIDRTLECRLLVVATGCWAHELLKDKVDWKPSYYKRGVSPIFKDNGVDAMIEPWAPYKYMMVGRLNSGELWTSDGTAIIPKNWTEERELTCANRLQNWIGSKEPPKRILSGIRPFYKGAKPCLLKPVNRHKTVWCLTGGGKFGTLAAGWASQRLGEIQP